MRITTEALAPRPTVWDDRDACVGHLSVGGSTLQLAHELDDLAERRGPERFAFGQQPSARVDREAATERGRTLARSGPLTACGAESELLVGQELACRVGVLALDHVEALGTDSGLLVGSRSGKGRRRQARRLSLSPTSASTRSAPRRVGGTAGPRRPSRTGGTAPERSVPAAREDHGRGPLVR